MIFQSYDARKKIDCETEIKNAELQTVHIFVQTWVPDHLVRSLKDPTFSYALFEWDKIIKLSLVVGSPLRCYQALTNSQLDGLLCLKITKKDNIHEGPFEAGQTHGMGIEKVLNKYLKSRNSVIKLLRIYLKIPKETVAESLNISVDELIELENSQKLVPFQLVPNLSKILNTDLKTLLVALGHAKESKDDVDQQGELPDIKIAAQYSGPELSKEEKIDLDELLKAILSKIEKTGGKK